MVMQAFSSEPPVRWLTAAPLWASPGEGNGPIMRRPALLRFTTDSFMEDFLTVATTAPQRLGEWQARKETWRRPAPIPQVAGPALPANVEEDPQLADKPLKLFQPGNQRFYLVTANLVCRIPGLPDKMLDFSNGEEVGFVLRRTIVDADSGDVEEYALVQGAWQLVSGDTGQILPEGEEQFPLFPVTYDEFDGHRRRLFAGLVPVAAREQYMNAPRERPAAETVDETVAAERRIEQLLTVLDIDVLEPWNTVRDLWQLEDGKIDESWTEIDAADRDELVVTVKLARDKLQTASWYILLDLAYFLTTYLPEVWNHIDDATVPPGTPGTALIEALQNARFRPETRSDVNNKTYLHNYLEGRAGTTDSVSLAQALKDIYDAANTLEGVKGDYHAADYGAAADSTAGAWPGTLLLLNGRDVRGLIEAEENDLRELVREAFAEDAPDPTVPVPLLPLAHEIQQTLNAGDYANEQFFIRCVYRRPNCPPTVRPTVVSEPTEPFQMASYFDPEAPARPIRIPLPVDTTPAGLRKFAKNTMFAVSDTLACQIEEVKGLTFGDLVLSVLPWPFHKDLDTGGAAKCAGTSLDIQMLCTLSIPIITLCALILLIIIVFLLDIIFKWVPYLIFCLPLPGFGGSED